MRLIAVEAAIAETGLVSRGVVQLEAEECAGELADRKSLLLLGFVGRGGWDRFAASPEAADGADHPLDRWSSRCIGALAKRFNAEPLFPFAGPPYWPFQRWAQRAESVFPSPLGLLIHPQYGLWHSYRGALAFREAIAVRSVARQQSPCDTCIDRPCLAACPVNAFTASGYDVDACALWLRGSGAECMAGGCRARHACPVGIVPGYAADQIQFGMRAFLAAR